MFVTRARFLHRLSGKMNPRHQQLPGPFGAHAQVGYKTLDARLVRGCGDNVCPTQEEPKSISCFIIKFVHVFGETQEEKQENLDQTDLNGVNLSMNSPVMSIFYGLGIRVQKSGTPQRISLSTHIYTK